MVRASRLTCLVLASALLSAGLAPASLAPGKPAADFDDCESGFLAAIGADAYQFSPEHRGDLGSVRLFAVLSYQRAAVAGDWGRALWRLQVRSARRVVYEARGEARLEDARGMALAEDTWDGRDRNGAVLPSGRYLYTFEARFVPDRVKAAARSYEELAEVAGVTEAYASTDEVILDHHLTPQRAVRLRASAKATTCQVQRHTPLEAGFPYNFYYGST
ncbi:MAG TPA: hypothetical protein VGV61_02475, partial [Thermoanaerobaculia bacterium]|nr:hypothetical protein [Thermoanaerobaculia bacterium]